MASNKALLTPELIIELHEKYNTDGKFGNLIVPLFDKRKTIHAGTEIETTYVGLRIKSIDGGLMPIRIKFKKQIIYAKPVSTGMGAPTATSSNEDKKDSKAAYLKFTDLTPDMMKETAYGDDIAAELLGMNKTFITALDILNGELEAIIQNEFDKNNPAVKNAGVRPFVTRYTKAQNDKNGNAKSGMKFVTIDKKRLYVLDHPIRLIKLPTIRGTDRIATQDFKKNIKDVIFIIDTNEKGETQKIPAKVGNEPLTLKNINDIITRYSAVNGEFTINQMTLHAQGASFWPEIQSAYIALHPMMQQDSMDDTDQKDLISLGIHHRSRENYASADSDEQKTTVAEDPDAMQGDKPVITRTVSASTTPAAAAATSTVTQSDIDALDQLTRGDDEHGDGDDHQL